MIVSSRCWILVAGLISIAGLMSVKAALLHRSKRAVGVVRPDVLGSCGGIKTGFKGFIASPNFPEGNYSSNANCLWTVIIPRDKLIRFDFIFMDIKNGPVQLGGSCSADWLALYDGNSDEAPLVGSQRYCGDSYQFQPVISTSRIVLVQFRSDDSIEGRGFILQYSKVPPPAESFDCNFDEYFGLCGGWTQSDKDDFNWNFGYANTPTGRTDNVTGPYSDRTLGTDNGTYAYIEATHRANNDRAILRTPSIDLSQEQNYCLRFWYHMHGSGIGSLLAYQLDTNEDVTSLSRVIFEKSGEQGFRWIEARVDIGRTTEQTRFAFVGVRGNHSTGDIALDDVSMTLGQCPNDDPSPMTPNNETQALSTRPRTIMPSTTISIMPSVRCAPTEYACRAVGNCISQELICDGFPDCLENDDEDGCNGIGRHSVYSCCPNVQGSCYGNETGPTGYIASPNFPKEEYPANTNCEWRITVEEDKMIRFDFVYMDMESGPQQIGGECKDDWLVIFDGNNSALVGRQRFCGNSYQFKSVYSTSNDVLVQFYSNSAVQGRGFALQYTAVDPFVQPFDCNFDNARGLCRGWIQSEKDDFDWDFGSSNTPSGIINNATGPYRDHTLGTKDGKYAYIEASLKSMNDTAVLISPAIDLSEEPSYCLRFWYHMHGVGIGSLLVYEIDADDEDLTSSGRVVFERHGQQEWRWMEALVEVQRTTAITRFAFSGVRGYRPQGDIAIDDVTMTQGPCTKDARTATTTTSASTATDCLENDDESNCDEINEVGPFDCSISEWGTWTPCSQTCGRGTQSRERFCDPKLCPTDSQTHCNGNETESISCHDADPSFPVICPSTQGIEVIEDQG